MLCAPVSKCFSRFLLYFGFSNQNFYQLLFWSIFPNRLPNINLFRGVFHFLIGKALKMFSHVFLCCFPMSDWFLYILSSSDHETNLISFLFVYQGLALQILSPFEGFGGPEKDLKFVLLEAVFSRSFSTDSSCQLDILGHDCYPLGVDCTQVGVFEEAD